MHRHDQTVPSSSLLAFGVCLLAAFSIPSPAQAAEPTKDGPLHHTFGANDAGTLDLGGHARIRWEQWSNFGFAPDNDDDFGLFRLYLHADARWTDTFRIYIEGKSALATDRKLPGGRRTLDEDSLDLQNAFLDIKAPFGAEGSTTLRLGRQELLYGKQRLVSPLDWANTRRTFEGIRLLNQWGAWKADLFLTEFVPIDKYDFNERNDTTFYGIYGTRTFEQGSTLIDLYVLAKERAENDRYTAGGRLNTACSGIDIDIESATQWGDAGAQDVDAWFVGGQVGYSCNIADVKPRLFLGYDYASGDSDPNDGDNETFDQLFPLAHAYYGYVDLIGRRNMQDFSQGISAWNADKTLGLLVAHHIFERAESADAVYNAGGGILRAPDDSTSKDVGNEIDVVLTWKAHPSTTLQVGYGHFEAGDFIKQTGASADVDFGYLSAQYTF